MFFCIKITSLETFEVLLLGEGKLSPTLEEMSARQREWAGN